MDICLLSSPYYLGHRDVGMGAGPTAFLDAGLEAVLEGSGHDVTTDVLNFAGPVNHEVGASFLINRLQSEAVAAAMRSGSLPLMLAGNCNCCLGMLSGLGISDVAVVWFDAHGDFHTAESSSSGFFDGMGLNIATGNSWKTLAGAIPGFRPVPELKVVLAGIRDLEPTEKALLDESRINVVPYEELRRKGILDGLVAQLDAVSARVRDVYLHVDLDVLDPSVAPINSYQPEGGLQLEELLQCFELVGERFQVRAATVACYDPSMDPDGDGLRAGTRVISAMAEVGWCS